ncbi:glycosyltransferase family 2 protein [Nonlabens agnitus]|uniref:Glycosyltransferase 2-like domain-containing protein n=1 Tax=Nonlabens agnitus TaxID=870484 RepID=A0A2S9WU45_9FLAO|nr:glycosyltransferase family 2 protein [Nonlabens agnitus]PRP66993.1 hypothetical protein BST86_07715 [Nonlabens agnitus]
MSQLVSIIIPTYNRAHIIGTTLDSIVAQTYQNWECVIVDDGSTDDTLEVLQAISRNDPRFKIHQRPSNLPKGASSCRNIGIDNSDGDYIIFLDSDDTLEVHCLKTRVDIFNKKPSLDFLVFPMGVYSNEHILKANLDDTVNHLNEFLSYRLPWSIMCPIWKANFIKELGGFTITYPRLNDPELMIRALLMPYVSYQVISDVPYDSVYYPSISNWPLIIDKYFQSLELLIPDVVNRLNRSNRSELKVFLRGYLKVWYYSFYFPSNKNYLFYNLTLIKLFLNHNIISRWQSLWLGFYITLYVGLGFLLSKVKSNKIFRFE